MVITKAQLRSEIVLFIILLVTLNQLAITLYTPSMPQMVKVLHTDDTTVQLTITLYVLGYGLSGFIYGPLSDFYGRRKTLLAGLSIFAIASFFATITTSVYALLFARFFQGIGNGCGDVIGRTVMCDVYDKKSFVKAASYISMATPLVPLVAPVIGGYIAQYFAWYFNFAFMFSYSVLSVFIVYKYLPETNSSVLSRVSQNEKSKQTLRSIFRYTLLNSFHIFKSATFICFFLPGLAAASGDLIYSLMAPFIMQDQLGLSPKIYGWVAVLPSLGVFMGASISHYLSHRASVEKIVMIGLILGCISGFSMLITNCILGVSIASIVIPMMLFLCAAGIIYPSTNAGVLTAFAHIAGVVSAAQGGLQTGLSGILGTVLAGLVDPNPVILAFVLIFIMLPVLFAFFFLIYRKEYIPKIS